MNKIVSNCPLCEAHGLHVLETKGIKTMQCINCGYISSDKYIGTKDNNEHYKSLPEDMKNWSKESDNRIWIPTIITLPFGMLYPINVGEKKVMKWAYAEMVDIPEDQQNNYPMEGQKDKFYSRRYDVENQKVYEDFLSAMVELNEKAKSVG